MLEEKAKPLLDYTRGMGHRIGNATECFGSDHFSPRNIMTGFDIPMPVLTENFETNQRTNHVLGTSGEIYVGMYIGPNKELVFSYQEGDQTSNPKKKPAAIFQPEEADHLLKGICYQSANGLGRTVPQTLLSLIGYRFSDKFKEETSIF